MSPEHHQYIDAMHIVRTGDLERNKFRSTVPSGGTYDFPMSFPEAPPARHPDFTQADLPGVSSFEILGFLSLSNNPKYKNFRDFSLQYITGDMRFSPRARQYTKEQWLKGNTSYTGSRDLGRFWPGDATPLAEIGEESSLAAQAGGGELAYYPQVEAHEIGGHRAFDFYRQYPDLLKDVKYYNPISRTMDSVFDALFDKKEDEDGNITYKLNPEEAHKVIYASDLRTQIREERTGGNPEFLRARSLHLALARTSKKVLEEVIEDEKRRQEEILSRFRTAPFVTL